MQVFRPVKIRVERSDQGIHRKPALLIDQRTDRQERVRDIREACAHTPGVVVFGAGLSDVPPRSQAVGEGSGQHRRGIDRRPIGLE